MVLTVLSNSNNFNYMKMGKFIKAITGGLFNAFVGGVIASLLGIAPSVGAMLFVAVSVMLGGFMPSGVLMAGVLTEVWTGEMVKKMRSGDVATFLDGVSDYSQYAENDVIHLVDIGADPDVLVNNNTYPIDVQELDDGDIALKLDKYQTKATPVTDDELYAISYDKMGSVTERHGSAILENKYAKAIHALAPTEHKAKTPVLDTTGDFAEGPEAESGRRMITRADIIRLKDAFDKAQIPVQGRRLVLCTDHVNDLLMQDQKFADQYYNYTTGKIANMYGFAVYEYVANPVFKDSDGKKLAFGGTPGANDYQASVAFHEKRVFKCTGSTKTYYSAAATDPLNQRNLINFRHYFVVLPKKSDAIAAIRSVHDNVG